VASSCRGEDQHGNPSNSNSETEGCGNDQGSESASTDAELHPGRAYKIEVHETKEGAFFFFPISSY
jgi:hypothetical protein